MMLRDRDEKAAEAARRKVEKATKKSKELENARKQKKRGEERGNIRQSHSAQSDLFLIFLLD